MLQQYIYRSFPCKFNRMGRSPCCVKEGLKKGPWTQDEDEKLIAFVKQHGHGNWRALPKKCGLLRCGKSCRLRWKNYLRPDIKRGMFTQSEEQKIFQLHALVGNKWAFIASQLPKRTDNEIKNYWNTVLKKRLQKERQNSLISFGALRTASASESRQRQDTKSMRRQDNQNNIKGSYDSASKKLSSNSCTASSVMSCAHLAQWESARLEAEARLAKESQSSRKAHTLLSFACNYMMHSFSSSNTTTTSTTTATTAANFSTLANHTHTNHQPLSQLSSCLVPNTLPSSISNPSCLMHHIRPSTINPPISSASSLSLPAIVSMPASCRSSASNSSSTSASSKSLSSLASQESIASALTLGPNGRLSWQAKEISFTTSPPTPSQSSLISQMLCQIERDHNVQSVVNELQASTKHGELIKPIAGGAEQELNLEATSSIIVDLNSTMESSMDLNCTMENWHDFIFDIENSCSDVVSTSTNWSDAAMVSSPPKEHGASSLISNTTTSGSLAQGPLQGQSSLDLEGLSLDSLISCENYANQHSNVLMKDLLWDTPSTLSISSTSIVN